MLNFNILALFLAAEDQIHQLCKWVILVNFDFVPSKVTCEGRNVATVVSSGHCGSALTHLFTSGALLLCTQAQYRSAPLSISGAFYNFITA